MTIKKKSGYELKLMREAGRVVALVHAEMKNVVKPGVTTEFLDKTAYEIIKDNKCEPTFKGYDGFPATICASVNEQVVHGFPSDRVLEEGDIISIDVGATYHGYVGDSAWTYAVGEIPDEKKRLMAATEEALLSALSKVKNNVSIEDVVGQIEDTAKANNLGIVRQYGGHGVGQNMHEPPFIFNYRTGADLILKTGFTVAIEPMLNLGTDDVFVEKDGWTVVTKDFKPSAHFEHTIAVTDDGCKILTTL